MNMKVIALTVSAFVVGMIELIIGGILPQIAQDLNITISQAGLFITIFSLVFAVSGPVLLTITAKFERKKLLLISLFIFFLGTLLSMWSPSFLVLMIARIINAVTGSLIIVLTATLAVRVVDVSYQARAIGFVNMGISSAIVIGIPIGVIISDIFNWRVVFLTTAVLTIFAFIIIVLCIPSIHTGKVITLREQWHAVKRIKIASAHLMMLLAMGAHYVMYAYLTPYLEQYFSLSANWISICYFIFGISAIAGGYMGGFLADKINPRRTILLIISAFSVVMLLMPIAARHFFIFCCILIIWGALSWAISPPQQTYLIQTDPHTSDIQQSLNSSALQLGISWGSAVGGLLISQTNSISYNSWASSIVMIIALAFAIFSITRKNSPTPQ